MTEKLKAKISRGRILHIVYFVDSNETRSASFRIRTLKIAFFVAATFSILSIAASITVYFLLQHNSIKGKELQELKAAQLAQAIVHENLLREAPFLVAADSSIMLSKQSAQVAEALRNGSTVDLNSNEPSFAEAERADDEADAVDQKEHGNQTSAATSPQKHRREDQPDTNDSVANQPPSQKKSIETQNSPPDAAAQPQLKSNSPNSPVAYTQLKAIYSDSDSRYLLQFVMQNLLPKSETLAGTLCAVLKGKNTAGEATFVTFPKGFKPNKQNQSSCDNGLRIRFSRLRPTEMLIQTEQLSLESVTFYLFSGGSQFSQEVNID